MTRRSYYLEDIPLDEAHQRIANTLQQIGRWMTLDAEHIPLDEALGRITAEPVWARLSSPHYHAAAMDGYAVNASDTNQATETQPVHLRINDRAYSVNTGDPMPASTNAVIMIEQVQTLPGSVIEIRSAVVPWQHVRLMGEDMVATELVLPANHRIRPVDLGAIAGCGHHTIAVYRQPRVTIVPTGSELIPYDREPAPGQIIEYNSLILKGQVTELGGITEVQQIVPDNPEQIKNALKDAAQTQPDLLLILSGSSAGSKDFTASAISDLGKLVFHGVAVRPGHPVIFGVVERIPVFGVPGYPVSAALTGEIFIQPLLAHWLGQPDPLLTRTRVKAVISQKLVSPSGDDDFIRVNLTQIGEKLLATPLHRGAGVLTSLVRADGLAQIPRFHEGRDRGESVEVRLYRPLDLIQRTVLAMGSHDPMIDLWSQHLARRFPGYRLTSAHVGSMGGLIGLKRGEAHLAGVHLLDAETGVYNLSYVRRYLPDMALQVITFAHREQGLYVAAGNPLGIRTIDDLPRVRYVNRQRGAGTRVLLDYELEQRDIPPAGIQGYEREEYTHLAVAAAVASGSADCGMGVRSGAAAVGLDFIPVGWERYDLVIPAEHLSHPTLTQLLEILRGPEFQRELAQQPGYNTSETGIVQMDTVSSGQTPLAQAE